MSAPTYAWFRPPGVGAESMVALTLAGCALDSLAALPWAKHWRNIAAF